MLLFIFAYEETPPVEPLAVTPPASFSQEQVNSFNKEEKLKRQTAETKLKETELLLATARNEKNLTEVEREEYNLKLTELEQANMTDAEKREHEATKLKETYESEKKELSEKLAVVQASRDDLVITRTLLDAAMQGSIVALDGTGTQVLAVLKHQAIVNEEGEVVVKNFTYVDGDKSFTEDLPAKEAIEKMKAMDSWANFWKDPSNPGFHTPNEGAPRGPLDVAKMSQEEYSKARKEGKVPWANKKKG